MIGSSSKAALRAALRTVAIDPAQRGRASTAIAGHVQSDPAFAATSIAAFVGVRHEPDTTPVLEAILSRGSALWLPRVAGDVDLAWCRVHDLGQLGPGRFGLPEPPPSAEDRSSLPDVGLVLVPGLAFGRDGSRLGQGRGYYDRALAGMTMTRIGLCLARFLDPPEGVIPMGRNDVVMHAIVTEDGYVNPASGPEQ